MVQSLCPLCNQGVEVESEGPLDTCKIVKCEICKHFKVSTIDYESIDNYSQKKKDLKAILQHIVFKMSTNSTLPYLSKEIMENAKTDYCLPKAKEQIDNLLLHIGSNYRPGERISITLSQIQPIIGSYDSSNTTFILEALFDSGLLSPTLYKQDNERRHNLFSINLLAPSNPIMFYITLEGWEKYEEIKHAVKDSRLAFMAMPFNNPVLDTAYPNLRQAVKETGFDLIRLDDNPPAGIIDNRLRLQIRKSRFVICDLTGGNQGAYWEAGFAEGLELPVFYMCERERFDKYKTHFDTNHCLTIIWDKNNLEEALEKLKACIRVTLFDEAIQEEI